MSQAKSWSVIGKDDSNYTNSNRDTLLHMAEPGGILSWGWGPLLSRMEDRDLHKY